MDRLDYDHNWINDPLKDDGGWSLELINPLKICSDRNNWSVSLNLNGGTPGFNNSVFNITPDSSTPKVMDIKWLDVDSLLLVFSETVNFTGRNPAEIFNIESLSVSIDMVYYGYSDMQVLIIHQILDSGKVYKLRIRDLYDCENHAMADTLVQFGLGRPANFNDILISELMVDEVPSAGLPESEYIELLNRSDKLLRTANTYLFDDSRTYNLPDQLLLPGVYYLLVPSSKMELFSANPFIIPMDKFPRLNNDGKMIGIYSNTKGLLFSIHYEKSWYKYLDRSEGGYSLEMVDTNNPCGGIYNWSASLAENGGTPGRVNSVEADNPDLMGPVITQAHGLEDNRIFIMFNEKLHPDCFGSLTLFVDENNMEHLWVYDTISLSCLEVYAPPPSNNAYRYEVKISGAKDCVGNPMKNSNIPFPVYVPAIADSGEVLINEILFNPKPGGVDWIEIYNLSGKHFDLRNWQISNSKTSDTGDAAFISEDHRILEPYSFLVLTENPERLIADFPAARREYILTVPDLPSMPDRKGYLILGSPGGIMMDELSYNENWHNLFLKNPEGVSLERVSLLQPSLDMNNWQSASSQSGYGTPTWKNSQSLETGERNFNFVVSPSIFSPDHDGYDDFLTISIVNRKPGFVANISIFDITGSEVKVLIKGSLLGTKEQILWDGFLGNGQKARPGHYILLLEMYHPDGDRFAEKEIITVAQKLKN